MNEQLISADEDAIQQVVSIVCAYVSHNSMRATDLPEFIGSVHASIRQLAKDQAVPEPKQPETPAVPVKRSVNKDYIVCLEDGKKFKSLRRHLSSFHHLTPDEYRAKWNLPNDYPMVAPAYSATRSQLAKDSGLGQTGRLVEEAESPPPRKTVREEAPAAKAASHNAGDHASAEVKAKPRRGRPRKSA